MKICVCLKQVVHTYACSGKDPQANYLAPRDKVVCINPCDEAAMALAVDFKSRIASAEILILTLGPVFARDELVRVLAMGGDRLYQIEMGEGQIEPDAWVKSFCLSRAVHCLGGDIVLCGKESLDNCSGVVGAFLAHHLGVPFVSGIVDLKPASGGRAKVKTNAGRGRRHIIEAPLPAVFSVELMGTVPFMPSYTSLQKAKTVAMEKIIFADTAVAPKVRSRRIFAPRPRAKGTAVPPAYLEAWDRIRLLLQGSRIEKKGKIVKGATSDQVEEILTFLRAHDYI
jgi:electron transfer flavoprotein beta subunit